MTGTMSTVRRHSEPIVLRVANAIARYIGFGELEMEPLSAPATTLSPTRTPKRARPTLSLVPPIVETEKSADHKWRRHPQLREYRAPISEDVRMARTEAVRGLCAARSNATEVAITHFVKAASCDDVELTAVPGFWKLTRGQMQIAVDAYEQVGRYRDAAALDAHISTIFRPSLLGASRQPVAPRVARRQMVNS